MTGIRKFVVGAAAAAGMAAIGMVLATQGALASTAWFDPGSQVRAATTQSTFTPSAACTAAIQALKEAITADRAEDAAERAVAKTEGTEAADQAEDAAEITQFKALWTAIRTACAPAAPVVTRPAVSAPSAACTAAVQALKAAWAQGRPTTRAQWQQLQTLAQAAKTACGWSWTWSHP